MHTSKCTSTIETAVYENRTYGGVRGRRLVTASYSIFAAPADPPHRVTLPRDTPRRPCCIGRRVRPPPAHSLSVSYQHNSRFIVATFNLYCHLFDFVLPILNFFEAFTGFGRRFCFEIGLKTSLRSRKVNQIEVCGVFGRISFYQIKLSPVKSLTRVL